MNLPSHVDIGDETEYRRVLGRFATGVAIVTSVFEDKPAGMTCQSFASVSLEPPFVAFFAHKDSSSWQAIRESEMFCVNIMGKKSENMARIFATPGVDKFRDVEVGTSKLGLPILPNALATIDCSLEQIIDTGDHEGALGRVQAMSYGDNDMPLLFFRGGYGSFTS